MARISELHHKWMNEPKYRKAHAAMEDEFALAKAVIGARNRAGLTQSELAVKMGTTQPVVARMEGGRVQPSLRTPQRLRVTTRNCYRRKKCCTVTGNLPHSLAIRRKRLLHRHGSTSKR